MKLKIVIKGKVHDVGYRPFLLGIAESLEIERFFADNTVIDGKQAVEILLDDDEEKVNAFLEILRKKKPEKAEVETIETEEHHERVARTGSYYRYLTAMQLAKIAEYGGKMLEKQDEMLERQDLMLEKQDTMLDKQDMMIEKQEGMLRKQDETINVIKEESGKTRTELKAEIGGVREEITNLRSDLKEYMNANLSKIREEISEIKQALKKAGIM